MTGQGRYLTRMIVFLIVVAAVVALLWDRLLKTFMNNPPLNGVILAVLVFGIALRVPPDLPAARRGRRGSTTIARTGSPATCSRACWRRWRR